jgi:hypothetical protein
MKFKSIALSTALAAGLSASLTAPAAFAAEQYFPVLVYRTGAYAPNGVPFANGYVDYLKYVNAKGGINGVKITFEECETGYATDKGVECYEPAAVHRHHLRTDREGARRQDPAHHLRLRACRHGGRSRVQVELPADRYLLDGG